MTTSRRLGRRPRPVGTLLMPSQVLNLVLPAHIAVGALPRGEFSAASWHDLAVFCDVVQLLAHEAEQEDVLSLGREVNQTLIAIRERHTRLGRWGASGPEQTFLRDAINPLDHFYRRQTTHKVKAALLRLDAALAKAEAEGAADPLNSIPRCFPWRITTDLQERTMKTSNTTKTTKSTKKPRVIDGPFVLGLRKELGLNQGDFWKPFGVTQSGGSRYESGRKIPAPTRKLIWAVHVAGLLTDEHLAEA